MDGRDPLSHLLLLLGLYWQWSIQDWNQHSNVGLGVPGGNCGGLVLDSWLLSVSLLEMIYLKEREGESSIHWFIFQIATMTRAEPE